MKSLKRSAFAILAAGTLSLGSQTATASAPNLPAVPFLTTPYATVELAQFILNSTTCGPAITTSGPPLVQCVHGDGILPPHLRLDQRIKASFRGTVTLSFPPTTDTVSISYGRQPPVEHTSPLTVEWPIPGSGTYYMRITIKSHDVATTSEADYFVPLWVPRN